ncbi:ATP-binding protein [Streptomyces sp. NPDC008079]|uniref:ATP-binding protein n=1 Tax=Streptomyces sp. NPDC008079 TaxID=3364806 RepID=UPI0036EDBF7F
MASDYANRTRLDLACEPSAPGLARRHAQEVLESWGLPDEVVQDALTVVSELTANAVRHAGEPTEPKSAGRPRSVVRTCPLTLWISTGRLYVAVQDQSDEPPELRPTSLDAESGRGLQIVAGLTEGAWGFERAAPVGKTVWASLRLAAPLRADKQRSRTPWRETLPASLCVTAGHTGAHA